MPKPLLMILFACLAAAIARAQAPFRFTKADSTRLPKDITYKGHFISAIRWTDKRGENLVVTSETGAYQNPAWTHESEGQDAEVFARHYLLNDSLQSSWRVYDFIKDCPLDMEANFIKTALQATDLDGDGLAEVWVMYKMACRGDVSPSELKLIMYEDGQKFAMRGETKVQLPKTKAFGGGYKFDKAFATGPKRFRDFALRLWNKNAVQKW